MIHRNSTTKPTRLTPPLKWPGGKNYLAKDIISLMPAHTHYVEPYFGGGAVLLAKALHDTSPVSDDMTQTAATDTGSSEEGGK